MLNAEPLGINEWGPVVGISGKRFMSRVGYYRCDRQAKPMSAFRNPTSIFASPQAAQNRSPQDRIRKWLKLGR